MRLEERPHAPEHFGEGSGELLEEQWVQQREVVVSLGEDLEEGFALAEEDLGALRGEQRAQQRVGVVWLGEAWEEDSVAYLTQR
jgi:hypothetical protein